MVAKIYGTDEKIYGYRDLLIDVSTCLFFEVFGGGGGKGEEVVAGRCAGLESTRARYPIFGRSGGRAWAWRHQRA